MNTTQKGRMQKVLENKRNNLKIGKHPEKTVEHKKKTQKRPEKEEMRTTASANRQD